MCALTYGKDWGAAVSLKDSELPPGLKAGHSALCLPWNNGAYAADSPREAVADALHQHLTDPARWAGLDGQAVAGKTNRWVVRPPRLVHEPVRLPPPGADSLRLRLYHLLGSLDVSRVRGAHSFPRLDTLGDRLNRNQRHDGPIPIACPYPNFLTAAAVGVVPRLFQSWHHYSLNIFTAFRSKASGATTEKVVAPRRSSRFEKFG